MPWASQLAISAREATGPVRKPRVFRKWRRIASQARRWLRAARAPSSAPAWCQAIHKARAAAAAPPTRSAPRIGSIMERTDGWATLYSDPVQQGGPQSVWGMMGQVRRRPAVRIRRTCPTTGPHGFSVGVRADPPIVPVWGVLDLDGRACGAATNSVIATEACPAHRGRTPKGQRRSKRSRPPLDRAPTPERRKGQGQQLRGRAANAGQIAGIAQAILFTPTQG